MPKTIKASSMHKTLQKVMNNSKNSVIEGQKGATSVTQEKGAIKEKACKSRKKAQTKEDKKKEKRKKEEKSVRVLKKAIAKNKESQQKLSKKLNIALKQVGLERRKQNIELNKLKKKTNSK